MWRIIHDMNIDKQQIENLAERCNHQCELCRSDHQLSPYLVTPKEGHDISEYVYACQQCQSQINHPETLNVNHWHGLNESIWSEVSAVKVLAWRILQHLQAKHGPQDLLDMIYLTDEELNWAKDGFSTSESMEEDDEEKHRDSNGDVLAVGDDVFLIKDLKVKGGGFTAKQGTKVKGISLVPNNPAQIEGRVESQRIVILTEFVKKQ